jgi:Heterokaryon incompatibility protein (HET)
VKRRKPVTSLSTRKTTTHYQYLPLDEAAQEIRLLTLLPGASSAEIRILLHANSFTQHNAPKYEALSYAWGSSKYVVNIKVGSSGSNSLAVTQNLAVALRYLRHKNETRVLWIDAICVDQGNLEERSRQVQRMSDIYRKAQRVVVWLGPAKNYSGFALKLIQELSSKIEVDWLNQPATEDVHDQHWASVEAEIPYDNHQWHALQALLSRSWLERLWVWQEILLADLNTAIVMCGFDFILWRDFKKAIYCLFCKVNQSIAFQDKIRQAFRLSNDSGPKILMDLVNKSTQAKCSDDRDRIYALLGILDRSGVKIGIIPNYTKTTSQVYQDTALSILSQTRKLDLLSYSEMTNRRIDIPSWVPDRSCVRDCNSLECQLAAGPTWSNMSYLGGRALQTTGVLLGAILHIQVISQVIYDEDIIEAVQNLVFNDALDDVYVAGGSMLDAYCRTLCGNLFSETILPCSSDYPSFDESKKLYVIRLCRSQKSLPRLQTRGILI